MNQRIIAILVLIGTPILNRLTNHIEDLCVWIYHKWYSYTTRNRRKTSGVGMPILTYYNMKMDKGGVTYTDWYKIKEECRRIIKDTK